MKLSEISTPNLRKIKREIDQLKETIKSQEKVISLAKELVELIVKNSDYVEDIEIIQKAEILSCDNLIMMARYP